jgi:hypothetical protein
VWGQNDPFFIVPGAQAFVRDLPQAELHLINGGHFLLEEHSGLVAGKIIDFLGKGQKTGEADDCLCSEPPLGSEPLRQCTCCCSLAPSSIPLVYWERSVEPMRSSSAARKARTQSRSCSM